MPRSVTNRLHMKSHLLLHILLFVASRQLWTRPVGSTRQAQAAKLGAKLMPFKFREKPRVFIKTGDDSTQAAVAKVMANTIRTCLVRAPLQGMASIDHMPIIDFNCK